MDRRIPCLQQAPEARLVAASRGEAGQALAPGCHSCWIAEESHGRGGFGARPGSVGGFVSYGCIRMYNKDILDLYQRVSVGTRVVVTR